MPKPPNDIGLNVDQFQTTSKRDGEEEQRDAPAWMKPSKKNGARVIHWDFESIGSPPSKSSPEGFHEHQTPYEAGLTLFSHKLGRMVSASFKFTPPIRGEGLLKNLRFLRDNNKLYDDGQEWIQWKTEYLRKGKESKTEDDKVKNRQASLQVRNEKLYNEVMEYVTPMLDRTEENIKPIPWGTHKRGDDGTFDTATINGFLAEHGYVDENGNGIDTHFVTQNGINFDNDIMHDIIGSDPEAAGLFGQLFTDAPRERKMITDEDGNEVADKTTQHSKTWSLSVPRHHDTGQIMTWVYGATGRKFYDNVTVMKPTQYKGGAPYAATTKGVIGDPNMRGSLQGTGFDSVRRGLERGFNSKSELPLLAMLAGEDDKLREQVMVELGISEEMKEYSIGSEEEAAAYIRGFMDKVAHTGSGDTIISASTVVPMLVKDIERDWLAIFNDPEGEEANELAKDIINDGVWVDENNKPFTSKEDISEHFGWPKSAAIPPRSLDEHKDMIKARRAEISEANIVAQQIEDYVAGNPESAELMKQGDDEKEIDYANRMEELKIAWDEHIIANKVEGEFKESWAAATSRDMNTLNKEDFPESIRDLIGDKPIDVVKWRGGDSESAEDSRNVVIIPIGNTRVAFYGSKRTSTKGGKATDTVQRWKPILGVSRVRPFQGAGAMDLDEHNAKLQEADENAALATEDDIWVRGESHYLDTLFGDYKGSAAPLYELGKVINETLMSEEIGNKITTLTSGWTPLSHEALNERINNNSTEMLQASLREPTTYGELMPEVSQGIYAAAMDAHEEDINDIGKFLKGYTGEDGKGEGTQLPLNLSGTIFAMLLDDPTNNTENLRDAFEFMDKETGQIKESFYTPSDSGGMPTQLGRIAELVKEAVGTDMQISHKDMDGELLAKDFDEAKGELVVDFNQLLRAYFTGAMPPNKEGEQVLHPNIFSKTDDGGNENSPFVDQVGKFLAVHHAVTNLEHDPADVAVKLGYNKLKPLDNHSPFYSETVLRNAAINGETGSIEALGEVVNLSRESRLLQSKVDSETKTRNAGRLPNQGKAEPTTLSDHKRQQEQYIKTLGSPYTAYHGITNTETDYTDAETLEQLFPTREKSITQADAKVLIETAMEEWEEDPTTLLRELEWIRENHPELIDQDKMQEALSANDKSSFVGKWIDAVKIASDSGANFPQVEAEKEGMKEDFMTNAHREMLRQQPPEKKGELVKNPPFEAPKPQKVFSLGAKARQLAEGQWKKTGYYNVWRQLRNVKRDNVGRKALEAAKKKDVGAILDMGITTDTQFLEHIGDLPVEGAEQRGLLGQLWQGKKTFRQLHEEKNKPDQQQNVAASIKELETYRTQMIQTRVPNLTQTEGERKRASKAAQRSMAAQDQFRADMKVKLDSIKDGKSEATPTSGTSQGTTPPTDSSTNVGEPDLNVASPTEPDKNIAKSLQVLKEYLASV